MYWPGPPANWAEAHNSFGTTAVATRWGLAEGRVGRRTAFQTYILLANPTPHRRQRARHVPAHQRHDVVKTFTVNPTSRFNVAREQRAPELVNETFGALIEVTNGGRHRGRARDVFRRARRTWAAGTNALATRLP